MTNLHSVKVSEAGNNTKNSVYIYSSYVTCFLNAGERKGPCRISFDKLYDIQIFISEKYQDPVAENATWAFHQPVKFCYLLP